ncbi:MAG: tetratricopeptide repeat protein [Bacteroidales bacterium]|nr:tetratricopeptide repeat protein [Bacteroidales bacterium]
MNKNRTSLLIVFLILSGRLCSGQTAGIDSLFEKLTKAAPEQQSEIYSSLAQEFIPHSFEKFTEYSQKAIDLAQETGNRKQEAAACFTAGTGHRRAGNYDTAYYYLSISLSIAKEIMDSSYTGQILRNIGYLYLDRGKYYDAYTCFSEDLGIAHALHDSLSILKGYQNMGIYYFLTGMQEKAIEYFIKVLDSGGRHIDNDLKLSLLINLSAAFGDLEKIDKAKQYLLEALDLALSQNDEYSLPTIYMNIGNVFKNKNEPDSALFYFKKSLEFSKKIQNAYKIADAYIHLGEVYFHKKDYEKSLQNLNEALIIAEKSGMKIKKAIAVYTLGMIEIEKKNYPAALGYYREALSIAESENARDLMKDLYYALYEACYAKGGYKSSIEYYKQHISLKDSIFTKAGNDKILELETRYKTEKKESEIRFLKETEELQSREINRQKTQKLYIIVISTFILITGVLIFNRFKLKQKQYKMELEKKNMDIEQKLLRSQMNPHFIFNSLNSIQSYISANNMFLAMSYLSKFARLMRLILDNTRKPYISLDNEINTLQLNMELEQIRFKNKFDFRIEVEEGIIPTEILIPPMLLQPYVENAIKHGLLNLEKKGLLTISYATRDNILICNIRDNGIGREAAARINGSQKTGHRSLGMEVTGERLNIMKKQTGENITAVITDLKDENNQPAGTNVELKIPYKTALKL